MQVLKSDFLTSCVTLNKFLKLSAAQPTIPYPKFMILDVFLDSEFIYFIFRMVMQCIYHLFCNILTGFLDSGLHNQMFFLQLYIY